MIGSFSCRIPNEQYYEIMGTDGCKRYFGRVANALLRELGIIKKDIKKANLKLYFEQSKAEVGG